MSEWNWDTFRCIPSGRVLLHKFHCVLRRQYGSCSKDCKYIPKMTKKRKRRKKS